MIKNKNLVCLLAASLTLGTIAMQAQDVDLDFQRSESRDVLPVPGHKVDHHGIVINPTPQSLTRDDSRQIDISRGFRLKDRHGKFPAVIERLSDDGVPLSVDYGTKAAHKHGVKAVSGAYVLSVGKRGVSVWGYDECGAFYGLQTLRQLLDSPVAKDSKLPYIEINDYPDLPDRGVVEGFYGTPWSHQVRLSLIDFYGRFKLNTYQYGPKDDPYHSSPNWRLPYPEKEARQIKELVEACRRNYVNFVWAVHPGKDIKWNEDDYQNLMKKFGMMYDLGVRSFAIYFDDISGDGTDPVRQVELLNRLDREFVKAKGDVAPLTVCPTDYTRLWANPTPQGSLAIYGQKLDTSVKVFWTGDVVCSDLTRETLDWVDSRIRRPAYYWWNFPVTDYVRHIVMQGPAYGLDSTLSAQNMSGMVSNPMEHGEASKLALYGVADYTWNISAYNPLDSWERGLVCIAPEVSEAYRTFAIHSCDTETGYRRAESWETETFRVGDYTRQQYDALLGEFKNIKAVQGQMEMLCRNRQLVSELRPWLAEFSKLGQRGIDVMHLIKTYETATPEAFWSEYLNNRMTPDDRKAYAAHRSGTMKLQPFYENAMDDMADGFYTRLTGLRPSMPKPVGSFASAYSRQGQLMFDGAPATYYTSGTGQGEAGDWIGADMGEVKAIREVRILQGRNSTDDTDYMDNAVLECSADGKTWNTLKDSLVRQYDIVWTGQPLMARYVRLRKLASAKRNLVSIRSFEVNPVRTTSLGFDVDAADKDSALYAFDNRPDTYYNNVGTLTFGVPDAVRSYIMLTDLGKGRTATVTQMDKQGRTISVQTVSSPLFRFAVDKNTRRVKVDGRVGIFEIVRQ